MLVKLNVVSAQQTLCTRLEKCEYDGALLVSARIAAQLQGGLGSPKMLHSRVARKSLDSDPEGFDPFGRWFLYLFD